MVDNQAQFIRKDDKPHVSETGLLWLLIILMMILLAAAVSIFGGTPIDANPTTTETPEPTTSQSSRVYTVSYKAGVFSPTNIRIKAGDTVRFRNDGLMGIQVVSDPHPTHDGLTGFDSIGDIPAGSFFSYTFAARGTFGYHNERNPKEAGIVIVR